MQQVNKTLRYYNVDEDSAAKHTYICNLGRLNKKLKLE